MIGEESIKKAVDWWANKISGNIHHDNGDDSFASVMSCFLADMGSKPVTNEQIEVFKKELAKGITEYIKEYPTFKVYLGCDYGPCEILSRAADEAGIKPLNFPFKTGMYIEADGKVRVSDGYAHPFVEI